MIHGIIVAGLFVVGALGLGYFALCQLWSSIADELRKVGDGCDLHWPGDR